MRARDADEAKLIAQRCGVSDQGGCASDFARRYAGRLTEGMRGLLLIIRSPGPRIALE